MMQNANVSVPECFGHLNRCKAISSGERCKHFEQCSKRYFDQAETERNKKRKKRTTEAPSWIYDDPYFITDPEFTDKIRKVEEALGFKLFYWQKTYIYSLKMRQSGQTLAEVLHQLVGPQVCLCDTIRIPAEKDVATRQDRAFYRELIRVHDILERAGIPVPSIKIDNPINGIDSLKHMLGIVSPSFPPDIPLCFGYTSPYTYVTICEKCEFRGDCEKKAKSKE